MWLMDNSQDSQGGKEEQLEEAKGIVYASQQTCWRQQEKRSAEKRGKMEKTTRGTCVWKKGMRKQEMRRQKETRWIKEEKNLQTEL